MLQSQRFPSEDYSFFSGLEGDSFNPNNLSPKEQEIYGEVLGVVYDLMYHTPDRKVITGRLGDKRQLDFFKDRLNESVDFTYRELKDSRYRISIKNPLITHFCRNELPAVEPDMGDYILNGVLTNASLRTVTKNGRKIIHVNKNPITIGVVGHFADLKKLDYSRLDYPMIVRSNVHICYSLWFYAPKEVENYLIDDFELKDEVEKLPDYNARENGWEVLRDQALLRRNKNYDFMKYTGKLEVNGSRKKQDKNKKTGNNGSDRRRWRNIRGTQI
ncbi:MAG: hypothetical protein KAT28_01675 [Candidatus Aenigmarchaeota archaeon]|nr:hypothetical protein [Candidatus Aenigmarchaeota archaeon]